MYEVLNMNDVYYHCLASNLCIDLSCFLSTFVFTERSLASLPPLLPLRHLRYWPHISLYIVMSKAVYSLINIVMKTQTLPFTSYIADLLNGICPPGNIPYFPLACYNLYHLDVSISRSSVGFPLRMSSRTLYILPHRTDAQTSHVITSRQEGHYTWKRGHLLFY